MNFLSHFFIDWQEDDPPYSLGKVLPDLLRNFDGLVRVKPYNEMPATNDQKSLHKGVEMHYAVDKYFHQSAFFLQNAQKVKNLMLASGFSDAHRYLFLHAHILLELMLDKLIIINNDQVAQKFYEQLGKIDVVTIQPIFRYNNIENHLAAFMHFYSRFLQVRYLYSYTNNESMAYALGRIISRVGMAGFAGSDHDKLLRVIPQVENLMADQFLKIFDEIRRKLAT